VTLPAPLAELPLLARAGAVVPLLSPDVDTLAPYSTRGIVHLADRQDRLELLAFPRGRSRASFGERGRLRSSEGPAGWSLTIAGGGRLRVRLQASLATLRRPFLPRAVTAGGRPLPRSAWSYVARTGVLTARFDAGRTTLRVSG
jgi:hypothetical protein